MKNDLTPCKNILRAFLKEIEEKKLTFEHISAPLLAPFYIDTHTPNITDTEFIPESDSYLKQEDAYTWIYAEPWHYRALIQEKSTPIPEYYLQEALPLYDQWIMEKKEIISDGEIIPPPAKNANLIQYLQMLHSCIQVGMEKRAVWIKSLKCFTQFIRDDTPLELHGNLECILPYKMQFSCDDYSMQRTATGMQKVPRQNILRNIEDTVYPIDIFAASDILKKLVEAVLEEHRTQHTAAETLGFAWLCHAIGLACLITREKIVHATPLTALKSIPITESEKFFQPEFFITIHSLKGFIDVPISKTLHDFLIALPRDPKSSNIFNRPISSLLRTLYNQGVDKCERASFLGKITFLTFMSQSLPFVCPRLPPVQNSPNNANAKL